VNETFVPHIVDLIKNYPAHFPHNFGATIEHRAQDFGGHHNAGCIWIHGHIARHQTNILKFIRKFPEFLIAQCLDWRCVNDALFCLECKRNCIADEINWMNMSLFNVKITNIATTVLPAEVCAETRTDWELSRQQIAAFWNGSNSNGNSLAGFPLFILSGANSWSNGMQTCRFLINVKHLEIFKKPRDCNSYPLFLFDM